MSFLRAILKANPVVRPGVRRPNMFPFAYARKRRSVHNEGRKVGRSVTWNHDMVSSISSSPSREATGRERFLESQVGPEGPRS